MPTSKVFEEDAVKVFLRLPTTCPLVRVTVAEVPMMTVLAAVVRLPAVKVSVPFIVRLPPARVTPLVLAMVRLCTMRVGGTSKPVVRATLSCA